MWRNIFLNSIYKLYDYGKCGAEIKYHACKHHNLKQEWGSETLSDLIPLDHPERKIKKYVLADSGGSAVGGRVGGLAVFNVNNLANLHHRVLKQC